jgi:hypothetical protein
LRFTLETLNFQFGLSQNSSLSTFSCDETGSGPPHFQCKASSEAEAVRQTFPEVSTAFEGSDERRAFPSQMNPTAM